MSQGVMPHFGITHTSKMKRILDDPYGSVYLNEGMYEVKYIQVSRHNLMWYKKVDTPFSRIGYIIKRIVHYCVYLFSIDPKS